MERLKAARRAVTAVGHRAVLAVGLLLVLLSVAALVALLVMPRQDVSVSVNLSSPKLNGAARIGHDRAATAGSYVRLAPGDTLGQCTGIQVPPGGDIQAAVNAKRPPGSSVRIRRGARVSCGCGGG